VTTDGRATGVRSRAQLHIESREPRDRERGGAPRPLGEIAVVQPAETWNRDDVAELGPLYGSMNPRVLPQGLVLADYKERILDPQSATRAKIGDLIEAARGE
jgi:hypothetical protein